MIEVSHLTKDYGSHHAVCDLSFRVEEGQIYGLLGPNGAGKSTIMNIITGYLAPTSGSVSVAGHPLPEEASQAKCCVGYLPEQPPLYTDMTVQEYLEFVAQLKKVPRSERKNQVLRAQRRTGLEEVAPRLIRNLSKGYRQRVGIAQALLGSPKIVILDEPTVGLDPAQVIEIRRLIRELGRAHTVILSSHILSEVQAVCDQVLILSHGRLMAVGAPQELSAKLSAHGVLHVTALGSRETVLQAIRKVDQVSQATVDQENGQEITVTARSDSGADLRAAVSQALAQAGCTVLALSAETMSLEQVFLELTESDPAQELPQQEDSSGAENQTGISEQPAEEPSDEEAEENTAPPRAVDEIIAQVEAAFAPEPEKNSPPDDAEKED